jgi:competence protein ComEC
MSLSQVPARDLRHWVPSPGARHPALLAAGCLCLGVYLADRGDLSAGLLLFIAIASAALGSASTLSRNHLYRTAGVLLMAFSLTALGGWRIASENEDRPSASLNELTESSRRVELFARVEGVPFQKSSGWRVPLELIAVAGRSGDLPVRGRVLLTSIPSLRGLRYSDYVRFHGRVYTPSVQRNPGGFDYADYLHRQGIDATVRPESPLTHWPQEGTLSLFNVVEPMREWIRTTLARHLGDVPQSLLAGLLLGDTDRLPKSVFEAFRESGTSHLLAVSGANVWLVVGMVLVPMYFFAVPRWPRTVVALVVIVLFSFLTRNEPSVVRASLMVGLILAGQLLWRPVSPFNAVGAAAVIIVLFAPAHLFRPGFQLSFAAVLGILIAVRRIEPLLKGHWRRKWAYSTVLFVVASVAATLVTAPISAWHFGTVPLAGIFANLLMVPLAGLSAHLGLVMLALSPISYTIAGWLSIPTGFALSISATVAEFFSNAPGAVLTWTNPSPVILIHLILIVALVLGWKHRFRWMKPLVYYTTIVLVIAAASSSIRESRSYTTLSLLDTGRQRIAILSTEKGGRVGLIDDPGLTDDLEQWVVQPYLRQVADAPSIDNWMSWRRLSDAPDTTTLWSLHPSVWRRWYSNGDLDTLGRPRVWADLLASSERAVLIFRDVPNIPIENFELQVDSIAPQVLVVPAEAETAWLREAILAVAPRTVVLYGRPGRRRGPAEELAFWRLRYPEIEFLSSAVHGGIRLEWHSFGLSVWPTIE